MWNIWDGIFAKFTIFASIKPLIMTRIERITHIEGLLDKSTEVIARLEQAIEDFAALQSDIAELEAPMLAVMLERPVRPSGSFMSIS